LNRGAPVKCDVEGPFKGNSLVGKTYKNGGESECGKNLVKHFPPECQRKGTGRKNIIEGLGGKRREGGGWR